MSSELYDDADEEFEDVDDSLELVDIRRLEDDADRWPLFEG